MPRAKSQTEPAAVSEQPESAPQPEPAQILRFRKLAEDVPQPERVADGLFKVKLHGGDKDRYLLQGQRKHFSAKLAVEVPPGIVISVLPTPSFLSIGKTPRDAGGGIMIEGGMQIISFGERGGVIEELTVPIRSFRMAAHHQEDWEIEVYLEFRRTAPLLAEIEEYVKPRQIKEGTEAAA